MADSCHTMADFCHSMARFCHNRRWTSLAASRSNEPLEKLYGRPGPRCRVTKAPLEGYTASTSGAITGEPTASSDDCSGTSTNFSDSIHMTNQVQVTGESGFVLKSGAYIDCLVCTFTKKKAAR